MKVISKKNTKRLLKGHQYEVVRLWNDGSNNWRDGDIKLKEFNSIFSVKNFTDINGNQIPSINYSATDVTNNYLYFKFENVKKGDILVCESDAYKTFIKGGMYKIEKTITINTTRRNYNSQLFQTKINYIKFVGIKRKFKFNGFTFRKLTIDESRKISLSQILDNEDSKVILKNNKRNIDLVDDKDDVLLKILSKSILDDNRHHLSIIDWACAKKGEKLSIEKSDYEPYLNMTLKEILEKIK